eukprot:IDg11006t1
MSSRFFSMQYHKTVADRQSPVAVALGPHRANGYTSSQLAGVL